MQVELEKDNAFGLGFYLYGLGPDRLVPYVSIFVKDVIKGGYVDRQGMIKPHDQILKCGREYLLCAFNYIYLVIYFL